MLAGRGAVGSVWPGVRRGSLDRENGGKEACSSVCVWGGDNEEGMEARGQDV